MGKGFTAWGMIGVAVVLVMGSCAQNTTQHFSRKETRKNFEAANFVTTQMDMLTLTVGAPFKDGKVPFCTALLFVNPSFTQGKSMQSKGACESAEMSSDEAILLMDLFRRKHFFIQAKKYYSERSKSDSKHFSTPEDAKPIRKRKAKKNTQGSIQLNVFDDQDAYYYYYILDFESKTEARAWLAEIRNSLQGKPGEILDRFINRMK
jgi:hypothetical protein